MNVIEEIRCALKLEIRPTSKDAEYLEAVIDKKDLVLLNAILTKHFGPAAKEGGKKAKFSKELQKIVDALGGLRIEQSFYHNENDGKILYAALWPWQSDSEKITLKIGSF